VHKDSLHTQKHLTTLTIFFSHLGFAFLMSHSFWPPTSKLIFALVDIPLNVAFLVLEAQMKAWS
jgi:hypothetical protein